MSDIPSDQPGKDDVIGKLCILEYEMPVTEELLLSLAKTGSEGLDNLFDFSVPYSTTLLSSIPAFFQQEVDFPVIADQVLGTIYKHPRKWKQLLHMVRNDPGIVTLYVCPITGVPKLIASDEIFEIKVNGLNVKMTGTGVSKLSRISHQDVEEDQFQEALEYLAEIGFVGAMIEDMNEFVAALFKVISGRPNDTYVDFFQELLLTKEVSINMDIETGAIEVDFPESSNFGEWSDTDDATLQELLGDSEDFLEDDVDENIMGLENDIESMSENPEKGMIFGEFSCSREDLKDKNATFIKGNDTQH